MSNVVDAELMPSDSRAVTVRQSMAVGQAMGVDEIVAQVHLIQQVMRQVMKEGEHFGAVPGCGDKKVLLQPGAQKLTMTFRLCPEYAVQETELPRGHKEYRVICTLKSMGSGGFVGQGVGCCSSMESKYRWRGGARKCPDCGKETIIKGKAEFGGGWLCWPKKGGCGSKWPDGAQKIEEQNIDKVENDNPADTFNTVFKMAKKRAFVDATITATAASDIFTQDLGDDEGDDDKPPAKTPPPTRGHRQSAATAAPQDSEDELSFESSKTPQEAPGTSQRAATTPKTPPKATQAANSTVLSATQEQKTRLLEVLKAEGPDAEQRAWMYFIDIGALTDKEPLGNLELSFVPRMASQMRELGVRIAALANEGKADRCIWMPPKTPVAPAAPATATPEKRVPMDDPEWWRDVVIGIPIKGMKREEYLKNPQTIGSLYDMRHGNSEEDAAARQRLWGFLTHFEPKGWTKRDGTQMPPSDADVKFRVALDALADFLEKNGEKL